MQIKMKEEEAERALPIFFLRCTKIRPRNEWPLNVIEVFLGCEDNHSTNNFPSLPYLKFVYQGGVGSRSQKLCFINQRRPPGPQPYQQGIQGAHYPQ